MWLGEFAASESASKKERRRGRGPLLETIREEICTFPINLLAKFVLFARCTGNFT